MRDRRLQRIEAIVQRQQRMPAKGDDDRLVLDGQDRRSRLPGTRREIGRRDPLLPLGDRLRVDPVASGQNSQALLTMLYRSTDCLSRAGASVEYLAHSASFHPAEKIAPSNSGTKHLGPGMTRRIAVGPEWKRSGD